MNTKKIIIWIVVVAVVVGVAYYAIKSSSDQKASVQGDAQAGATATPEQVQGQEVTVGTGDEAKPGMEVSVEYTGKLTDGTVFDTNVGKTPLVFTLGSQGIIPGFQVGVNGMKVGGERLIAVPPSLAYGDQAVGTIPANSTLIFDVKLLKVATPAPATAAPAAN
jgi:FK506-binding nuclear protein